MKPIVVALMAASVYSAAANAGPISPVQAELYRLELQNSMLKAEDCGLYQPNFDTCIDPVLRELKDKQANLTSLLKAPKHVELWKTHIVAARLAVNGFKPEGDELKIDYRRRVSGLKARAAETWERLKIEME